MQLELLRALKEPAQVAPVQVTARAKTEQEQRFDFFVAESARMQAHRGKMEVRLPPLPPSRCAHPQPIPAPSLLL